MIELCAVHAGLSAACFDVGFAPIPVDWAGNKHQASIPIFVADLTTEAGQALVWRLIEQNQVAYIHMGPPCGTASRARERRVPQWLRIRGAPDPKPLRSAQYPRGLPSLEATNPIDASKVAKANAIYAFCCRVALHCIAQKIGFTIENPTNSYLRMLPEYQLLAKKEGVIKVNFHACMWGARRPKMTSFLTNVLSMHSLARSCDRARAHLP